MLDATLLLDWEELERITSEVELLTVKLPDSNDYSQASEICRAGGTV